MSDALAVYVADEGVNGIKKFANLVREWKRKGDIWFVDYGTHVLNLAWMALYCEWPKEDLLKVM